MNIELLHTFLILAQTKNFSKAAELQHVVQSTVTTRIREMECTLGKRLFTRTKQKVELTEAGILFSPYAERMLQIYEEGKFKIAAATSFDGRLVIGSVDSIWRNLLFPVLKEYITRYPTISLKATTSHSPEVIQMLVDGVIDVALVYQAPRLNRFEVYVCDEDDFALVVNPNHQLAQRSHICIEELPEINLLYHNWSGPFFQWIQDILPHGQLFKTQIDPSSLILALAKEGLGPAILTRSSVTKELAAKTLIELPLVGKNRPPVWCTYAVVHRNKINEPPIQHWMHLMSEFNFLKDRKSD